MKNEQNVQVNDHIVSDEISEKDIARAIHSIAYRKAYNQRADVQRKRKEYNRVRSERIAIAVKYIKQHPEEKP